MSELFGSFGMGLVQGLATSTDKALSKHIKDNKDRFDKNLEAALTRNLERSTRYDKKSREAREALDLMAGFTGGDFGKASEIIQGIGGVSQTQGFVDKIRARQSVDEDFDFSGAVSYIEQQRGTLTPQQAIDQILTPYSFTTPPQTPKKKGLLSILDDPRSMAVQAKKEWLARGNTIREVDDIIKRQGATINYNKLATPDQLYAMDTAKFGMESKKLQVKAAKQAINAATMNNKILAETVKAAPEQSRLNMEKLSQDVKMGRFNYETAVKYDRPALEIGYAVQEATLLDKRSGKDYEENLVKIDTQLDMDQRKLAAMRVAGQQNSDKYKKIEAAYDTTVKHRVAVGKAASKFGTGTSIYGKLNPVTWHKSTLRNNFTAAGIGYKTGLNDEIIVSLEGQGPKVQKAYAQTFSQLYAAGGNDPNMKGIIKTAYDQMMSNEQTVVQNKLDDYKRALAEGQQSIYAQEKAPKPLYVTERKTKVVGGETIYEMVIKGNRDGSRMINPKVKLGDLVIVNSGNDLKSRSLRMGYQSNIGVFMSPNPRGANENSPYILGVRKSKDSQFYPYIHGTK